MTSLITVSSSSSNYHQMSATLTLASDSNDDASVIPKILNRDIKFLCLEEVNALWLVPSTFVWWKCTKLGLQLRILSPHNQ